MNETDIDCEIGTEFIANTLEINETRDPSYLFGPLRN